jgi:hypothetical protein
MGMSPIFTMAKLFLVTRYEEGHEARDEPDLMIARHVETDFIVAVVRQASPLHLCGYVGIRGPHPIREVESYIEFDIECHGGVTYYGADVGYGCVENSVNALCGKLWGAADYWIGFDCQHAWDLSPAQDRLAPMTNDAVYRNFEYVLGECKSVAKQLYEMRGGDDD